MCAIQLESAFFFFYFFRLANVSFGSTKHYLKLITFQYQVISFKHLLNKITNMIFLYII